MANSDLNGAADNGARPEPPLRVSRSRRRMADWSLVLESAGIDHRQLPGTMGWQLHVADEDLPRARQALDAYDQETAQRQLPAEAEEVEPYGRSWIGFVAAGALIGFFLITGPSDGTSSWSRLGSSSAERIFQGEIWRAVTALTLHVDPAHLFGNALACAVFLTFLGNRLGPGLAIWLALLAGTFGNLITAAMTGHHHLAVGASTATFGALGGLVGLRATRLRRTASSQPAWMAVAAGAALFGMLGTGPGADVLAHIFGLVCGGGLGAIMVLAGAPLRNRWGQWLLAITAGAFVAVCWMLALSRGNPV
jgi:membrane associated rhomboid family serine protease